MQENMEKLTIPAKTYTKKLILPNFLKKLKALKWHLELVDEFGWERFEYTVENFFLAMLG